MASFQAKDTLVLGRQLEVQSLKIPFVITGNATPASVVALSDEPAVLFIKTAGIDQITPALDVGESLPTYVSQVDASGTFSILLKIQEQLVKVVSAKLVQRAAVASVVSCSMANTTGISSSGSDIALNAVSGTDFATGGVLDACLEVNYITAE